MNAERLLSAYEKIADAPDAIARLRRFVLDLAVRGKLVPQDPNDEPASELLKRIAAEKERLVKAGKIRTPPVLERLTEAEIPFEVPTSWTWVRVGEIFDYDAGIKREPKELVRDRWLLELEDIEKDTSTVLERLRVSDRDSRSTKSEFEVGDILYGKLRPYLNKVVVADEPGYSTTEIVAIRPFLKLCPEYCALAFRRPDFVAYVERLGRGTKMPRLRTPDAIVAAFPLPPLAEQHRIVAKVDELMALCDRLEAARQTREATRDNFTAASLARLNAPDPETFQGDARFALNALPALTARPDQIKQLRQTILNLAVRGKLVPQDPNDEPASELLKRIAAEKARLVKAGEIKKEKPLPPVEDDADFEVPKSWQWTRLGKVTSYIQRGKSPKYAASNRSFVVSQKCVQWSGLDLTVAKKVTLESLADYEAIRFLRNGDLLWNSTGTGTIGRVIRLDDPPEMLVCDSHVTVVRCLEVDPEYIRTWLRSDYVYALIEDRAAGSTNQVELTAQMAISQVVPLPPLAEQRRIVAKVDELMGLCDRLEASLASADETRRRLLEALLAETLAPHAERELEAAE